MLFVYGPSSILQLLLTLHCNVYRYLSSTMKAPIYSAPRLASRGFGARYVSGGGGNKHLNLLVFYIKYGIGSGLRVLVLMVILSL